MTAGVKIALGGLVLALGLALLSPLASDKPDGLEAALEQHGVASVATPTYEAPIPDYAEERGPAGKALAGVLGTVLVFAVTLGVGAALKKRHLKS